MENQHTPVHDESVIVVASNKKHSWSKKERLALSIAAVFALVGIGLGGFTFYNQVIANAAGEESLGSDVVVDLPPANESPYFTVTNVLEQDVFITLKGDAVMTNQVNTNYQNGDLVPGWRIEQTETPLDDASWKVVAQSKNTRSSEFRDQSQGTSSDGTYHIGLSSNLSDKYLYPNITDNYDLINGDPNDTKFLQPQTKYYFRITKEMRSTTGSATSWVQQGNYVQAVTKSYSDYGFKVEHTTGSTSLKFSWSGGDARLSSLSSGVGTGDLRIARVKDVNELYTHGDLYAENGGISEAGNTSFYNSGLQNNYSFYGMGALSSGVLEATQDKDTNYYYALVAANGRKIMKTLSQPVFVSTTNTTTAKPLISLALSPTGTIAADKANTLSATITSLDMSTGNYDASVTFDLVDASGKFIGSSCYTEFYRITDFKQALAYKLDECRNVLPGDYRVQAWFSRYTPSPWIDQKVYAPVTFSKVDPDITATFKDASVKYKKDVVINLDYKLSPSYDISYVPEGTFKIINLKTKKTIKAFNWDILNGTQKKITLKGVKKGTYNLALVYTADTKQGIYQDKTINLPKLTVK